MQLGFIGLGKMGQPMTRRLLAAGHAVAVHNRSRGAVEALAREGATACTSPAEVAAQADIVLTCLTNTDAVEAVYLGANGLIAAARPGQLFIDHSTVGPETSRALARAAGARGAAFLDAPVSGGPAGAEAGTLTIMVGGEADAFARAQPVFAAYGQHIHHVGPVGAGATVKLVNQLLVTINLAGLVEGLALGVKGGVAPQTMVEVLRTGFAGSRMLDRNAPRILARDFQPATSIGLLAKDLRLIQEEARRLEVRLLLGAVTEALFHEARALGLAEEDMAALVKPLERLLGFEIKGAT
jgi:3-hydroxyisobutyrate dehydrogenase-like beta-hydroxyacid dehydrogenase